MILKVFIWKQNAMFKQKQIQIENPVFSSAKSKCGTLDILGVKIFKISKSVTFPDYPESDLKVDDYFYYRVWKLNEFDLFL